MTHFPISSEGRLRRSWRVVLSIACVLIIYALGSRIPLPGLDPDALASQLTGSSDAMARMSIFALSLMPLFTMLAYAEIAKLIFPRLAKWQAASAENANRMNVIIRTFALILAAMQGYGIMIALEAVGLIHGTVVGFIAAGIACFVGSTALLIWLADRIRLPNLGNGFWLLWAAPFFVAILSELLAWIELTRIGAATHMDWLIIGVYLSVAAAMVVIANAILIGERQPSGMRIQEAQSSISLAVLLWPPFLASIAGGYLIFLPSLFAPELLFNSPWFIEAVSLALQAALIPVFVFAYARASSIKHPRGGGKSEPMPAFLVVAGIQVAICLGGGLLTWILRLPLSLNGGFLIAFVTVMLALRDSPGTPPRRADLQAGI